MGNSASQEYRDSEIVPSSRDEPPLNQSPRTKAFCQYTGADFIHKSKNPQRPLSRSTGTSTSDNPYAKSCLYRRKIYSESLPKLKPTNRKVLQSRTPLSTPQSHVKVSPTLPPLPLARPLTACASYSRQSTSLPALIESPSSIQQWNDSNETDITSEFDRDSIVSSRNVENKVLPKLLSVHQLLDKLDDELAKNKDVLRKTMDSLTDADLLIRSNPLEVIRRSEESVLNTQSLLSKMHEHIANTHAFCNLLHRADESFQMFSKAASVIASLDTTREAITDSSLLERHG